jgi:hypothetical protein
MKITIIILFVIGFLLTSAFSLNDAFANDGSLIEEVETLEHDTANGQYNSLVQVDADTYALAYTGSDTDGFISTFTISADGSTITKVETLEHDTDNGRYNSLVQVDADTYALAYTGDGSDGFISTFTIDSDGDITPIRIQNHGEFASASVNLEHDTENGSYNSLVKVDADTYALAYRGSGDDGFISTFTINSAGVITAVKTQSEGNNLEHDTENGRSNSLVQVDADTYALAYRGDDDDGFISTFTIDSDGDITPIRIQNHGAFGSASVNLEHDTEYSSYNSLVKVDADTYALAYQGENYDGFISTFTINSAGVITAVKTQSEGNNLEHDTERGRYSSLVQVDADTYALAYRGSGDDGFISTFTINSAGVITAVKTQSEGNNLEHDTENGSYNSLVKVDADTYALAYRGSSGNDGFISTFTIDSTSTSRSDHCYDCEPPKLQQAQIQISSDEKIIATDDEPLHITANVGDEIEITLDVTDNKSVHLLPTSGIYTNFMERPNNMNLFYANNFDDSHNTSTSFYEWHRNHDDVAYDYADTVTWSNPAISYVEFPVTAETPFDLLNDALDTEHFIISFKMKFTDSMESSQVWVSAADYYGQTFKVPLPLTLEILGDEPLDFTSNSNQKVLGYFNEPVLLSMLYQWSQSSQDMSELSSILGVNGELPQWTANLATWTVEEKITLAEMVIAIEHVINQ